MKLWFIRALLLTFFAAVMLSAGPTSAAPTCQDRNGLTIKCGVQGAMPVGWSLPFAERRFKPSGPSASEVLSLIATIGLLFALIALMPEFDGTRSSDWDKRERDDREEG